MNKAVFKWLQILIVIIFIAVSGLIMLYPFENRDLQVQVESDNQMYDFYFSKESISEDLLFLEFENEENLIIEKIRFYGDIKTVSLKNLEYNNLAGYIDSIPGGKMTWVDKGLQFEGENSIKIVFNEAGRELFKSLSGSFLLERLCLIQCNLIVCMVLFMICSAVQEKVDSTSRNNHGPIYEVKRFFKDIKKYSYYMVYSAQANLRAEVANSYLNRLWWLLEPFCNMIVYVIVFGGVMGRSIDHYAPFIFSALLMWNFFSKTINYSVKLVRNNRDILSKVYVPKFVLLISNMILNFFKLIFSMIVLVLLMLVFRVQIGFEIFWVLPAYLVLMLLSFGAGMVFLHYGVYVDDLSYAVGILLSMLMFLSGTFYDILTTLSEPLNTVVLCFNPIAMLVDTMRNALLYQEIKNIPLIILWFFISSILCCVGVHIVYKNENGYVKVV